MTEDVQGTIAIREQSHGDFEVNTALMQQLKLQCRATYSWSQLPPYQREAIEMICHKLGRILCGNSNFTDHWHDIAGYATLVENILNKQNTRNPD
jgi:hypothetical protein